jgi:hypothetical protein
VDRPHRTGLALGEHPGVQGMAAKFLPQPLALLGIEALSGWMRARRGRRDQQQTDEQEPAKPAPARPHDP